MLLDEGDKVLATMRRLYESEYPRFFLGVVEAASETAARILGAVHVWDPYRNAVVPREGRRRKLIAFASSNYILHMLDRELDLESVRFSADTNGRIWVLDGDKPFMELAERAGSSH
ncbi:MAG TPA: hypothetical protein VFD43_06500 [Planctomycetota bacterium]|nr:hypothetical protein [Planctomycetota bacterium]